MADDLKPLIVAIEASLTKFNKQMAQVAKTGADSANAIDKSFQAANENVGNSFAKSAQKATVSLGQQKAAITNLSFQLNDLAGGLMSGTSPFTLMAQQGSQVAQALQSSGGGVKGLLSTIGGAASAVVNPLSLATFAVIGLGAAAIQYFTSVIRGGELSDKELAEHEAAITKIGEAYKSIAPGLSEYLAAQKAATDADSNRQQGDITANQITGARIESLTKLKGLLLNASILGTFTVDASAEKGLVDINKEVTDYIEKVKAGTAGTDELAKVLADVLSAMSAVKDVGAFDDINKGVGALIPLLQEGQKNAEKVGSTLKAMEQAPDPAKLATYNDAMAKMAQIAPAAIDKQKEAFDQLVIAIGAAQTAQQRLTAAYAYGAATAKLQDQAVMEFGKTLSSSDSDYARIIKQAESGGNPNARPPAGSNSTASGLFQFTDTTFRDTVREFGLVPKEISDAMLMSQKNNVELQTRAFEALTAKNAGKLADAGFDASTLNKYILHFLGESGGLKLLRADPSTPVSNIVPNAIGGNQKLLGGGKTAAEAIAAINKFLQNADQATSTGGKSFQGSIQSLKDETEQLEAAAKAEGNLGTAIDDRTYKMIKAEEVTKLTQQAKKDGIALDEATVAQIDATAEAYARAKASNAGYKQSLDATAQAGKDSIAAQKKLAEQAARTAEQFAGMATGFVMGFISDLKSGKSAAEALTDALSRLADQLLEMALNSLFKMIFGQIFGGGGGGGLASLFQFHEGGVVGSGGKQRRVSPLAMIGAPRYHSGGVAGMKPLQPGEMGAILQRGETVLPRGFNARGGGGGNTTISNAIGGISIDMGATGLVASDTQKGVQFGKIVQDLIRREMVNQTRPGGLLTQTGSGGRIAR